MSNQQTAGNEELPPVHLGGYMELDIDAWGSLSVENPPRTNRAWSRITAVFRLGWRAYRIAEALEVVKDWIMFVMPTKRGSAVRDGRCAPCSSAKDRVAVNT